MEACDECREADAEAAHRGRGARRRGRVRGVDGRHRPWTTLDMHEPPRWDFVRFPRDFLANRMIAARTQPRPWEGFVGGACDAPEA